jgi:RecG-like helicase
VGIFRRLTQDEGERRAASVYDWARTVPGTTPMNRAEPRSVAKLAGVVEGLRVARRDGVATYEATLSDGTGRVTVTFLGRGQVPGLSLGRRMVVEGRLGGTKGVLQVMNPSYEFAPGE